MTELTQADIDAAVAKAVGPLTEKLEAADAKNAGLLDDLKKAQREARAAKDITPESHQAEIDAREKAEAERDDLKKQVGALTKERDTAAKALEAESGFTSKLLIQDGIKSALIANGVKDEDFIDTLAAKFSVGAAVVVDGETRKAEIGGKAVADAIKEWAASDAGKKFVAAPNNSGGGAAGSSGGVQGGTDLSKLSPVERITAARAASA